MSRTKRRPKRGAKAVDRSCRNHGECPWCTGNRTHGTTLRKLAVLERLAEALGVRFDAEIERMKGEVKE